jgi:hypothetical protein
VIIWRQLGQMAAVRWIELRLEYIKIKIRIDGVVAFVVTLAEGSSKTGCWGGYLGQEGRGNRGWRKPQNGKVCSFPHQILFG